jgi:hypothetical protein
MWYNKYIKNKNNFVHKNQSYNTISFIIFAILIASTFSFFTFADDTTTTLFEDFDRDGLSNIEEESLGTDPKKEDTDGDGYSDGVELESGYDPLIPAPGDRIVSEAPVITTPEDMPTTNVTEKISKDVVTFLADAQEEGKEDITPEELAEAVSKSVDEQVDFVDIPKIDIEDISIKEQDYDNLSEKAYTEQMREDAIEYFTAISYIFISNFPQGYFDRPTEEVLSEVMQHVDGYSTSLTKYSYFEDIAENAIEAEKQLDDIDVPKDLFDIHTEGLQLLSGMSALYEAGNYKKPNTDIVPVVATLAQMQVLVMQAIDFQDHIEEKITKYNIEMDDNFLNF